MHCLPRPRPQLAKLAPVSERHSAPANRHTPTLSTGQSPAPRGQNQAHLTHNQPPPPLKHHGKDFSAKLHTIGCTTYTRSDFYLFIYFSFALIGRVAQRVLSVEGKMRSESVSKLPKKPRICKRSNSSCSLATISG